MFLQDPNAKLFFFFCWNSHLQSVIFRRNKTFSSKLKADWLLHNAESSEVVSVDTKALIYRTRESE